MDGSDKDRGEVSQERIVEVSLQILDEEGLEGISMRRLGEALGVKAMTLYRYVQDKEEILELVMARLIESVDWPHEEGGPLAQRVLRWTEAYFRLLSEHPNAIPLFASRAVRHERGLRYSNLCLRNLSMDGQLEPERLLRLFNIMLAQGIGFAVLKRSPRAPVNLPDELRNKSTLDMFERLAPLAENFSIEETFQEGMQYLVRGLEAALALPEDS